MPESKAIDGARPETTYFRDPENPTLPELVALMQKLDEGLIEFDADLHVKTVDAAQVKVDQYKRFIDQIELEELRVGKEIQERVDYKRRLNANKQRMKDLLLYHHDKGTLLPGKEYEVKLRKSSRTLVKTEPNDDLYLKFTRLIRTKMEWKLPEVKAELKANPNSELAEFVDIVESKNINFSMRKGINL